MGIPGEFGTSNFQFILSSTFPAALVRSLTLGTFVSLLTLLLSLIAVEGIFRLRRPRLRIAILTSCAVAFFGGMIPRTFAFEYLLSDQGPMRGSWQSLLPGGSSLLYTRAGVVIAYLPILLPLCIVVIYIARAAVPYALVEAARDLGATGWQTHTKVVLPTMQPGLIVGFLLSFLSVVGDTIVVDLVGGSRIYTAANQIFDQAKIDDWGNAAAEAVVLLVCVLLFIGVSVWAIQRSLR
ncbi:MAG TPA: ABC transporter permease subunit [Thermoanaerobaculia bacterium]|nr:ABC transporter permease subunit [Thermoanaerobaculia bacterium]